MCWRRRSSTYRRVLVTEGRVRLTNEERVQTLSVEKWISKR